MDYSKITLGEMLSSPNEAIKRNAIGILKQIQKCRHDVKNERDAYFGKQGQYIYKVIACLKCGLKWKEEQPF